jgi:hypothetical protein
VRQTQEQQNGAENDHVAPMYRLRITGTSPPETLATSFFVEIQRAM